VLATSYQQGTALFITRYGYDVALTVALLVVLGLVVVWFTVDLRLLRYGAFAILLTFLLFTLYFLRDPDRTVPQGDTLVLAPADGTIVQIVDVDEPEYVKCPSVQISIFMSPLNVHVNRFPVSGTIGYYRYVPGEYLVAFDEKSSLRNERTHIGVENGKVRLLFKQIAGFVARRIVANVKVGDRAVAGARFGMIKFGSRVDVILPKSVDVRVRVGDKTVAGETVLAVVS
jgi:phosphatidylserine decarboxylase